MFISIYGFADTITALEYNKDGEYLATGDRAGRITVLKLENEGKAQVSTISSIYYCSEFTFILVNFSAKARKLAAVFSISESRP